MVELVDWMLELNKQKHSGKFAPSQGYEQQQDPTVLN
jgi:hypothetical protein